MHDRLTDWLQAQQNRHFVAATSQPLNLTGCEEVVTHQYMLTSCIQGKGGQAHIPGLLDACYNAEVMDPRCSGRAVRPSLMRKCCFMLTSMQELLEIHSMAWAVGPSLVCKGCETFTELHGQLGP